MKKNQCIIIPFTGWKKLFLMARITAILLFAGLVQVSASVYSQKTRLNLKLKDASIESVLKTIEDQSEFYFLYRSDLLKKVPRVSLTMKEARLEEVLDQVVVPYGFGYEVDDQVVVIKKTEEKKPLEEPIVQQENKVTGTVKDASGLPLPGVTVVVKGTTQGTVTNADGEYSLANIPEDATLQFSFVGMRMQEVEVGSQTSINIEMEEETIGIDEVVAIGYGTMKKSDLTGSVASVSGVEVSDRNLVNVSQSLQGITPGLMVTRSGGSAADASASIRVRGVTTIGDSNPLIIVDGVPVTSLDWVNPNDIENISVLKDAASASIYGSKAASGVILVTTKKAKSGQLQMSYDYNYIIEQPTRVAEYANVVDYMKVLNEISWNDNNNEGSEFPIFTENLIENYYDLHADNPDQYPATDWRSLMVNKLAASQRHAISISAGAKNISTFISLNYDKTNALYDGRNYDRITLRANNDVTINKYFSLLLNINALYSVNNKPRYNVTPGPINGTIYAAEWQDGRIAGGKTGDNPYALLKYGGSNESKSNVLGGKVQLNYTPLDNLSFSAIFSPELVNTKGKFFRKKIIYTPYDDPSTVAGVIIDPDPSVSPETSLDENRNYRLATTTQFLANYSESFSNHNIVLMAGSEEYYLFNENLGAFRDRYSLTSFPYLDIGNENYQFNSGSAYEYASRSFFGRLNYNYKNKYLFQSNIRYDGSSRFAKDYRWGLFPSYSLGWVLTEESFMRNIEALSFFKLRASYGTLGNERIGNYPYQSTLAFGSTVWYQGNNAVSAQTVGLTDYAIEDISWETTKVIDVGFDANFLKSKLRIIADYYKKDTRDMLLALEIPNYIGQDNPQQNTGKMYTNGWELSIGWSDQIGDLKYSANVHLSDSKSVMGDLGGTEFLGSQVKFEGSEFNEWYGYKSEGIFQTQEDVDNSPVIFSTVKPGDIKYKDISGAEGVPDGNISPEYDRVLLGGSLPRYLYGGNIDIKYKNFDLNLIFQGIGKQNTLINTNMVYHIKGGRPSLEVPQLVIDNYWSKYNSDEQNKKVKYPRVGMVAKDSNNPTSDYWIFNGGYFRLKNLNIGYSIQSNFVSNLGINGFRLSANVTNLFSIDNYPEGWDPETTSNYWITRAFSLGVSVKF